MVKFTHKITIMVTGQIILIVASFLIIVHFESQTNLTGNIVNIAGKNRVLTILVHDELSYELLQVSDGRLRDGGRALAALGNLEENMLFLRGGGTLSGVTIDPLPPRFGDDWNAAWYKFEQYKSHVSEFVSAHAAEVATGSEGHDGDAVADDDSAVPGNADMDDITRTSNEMVVLSDTLTDKLGRDVNTHSSGLILMQASLGTINVAVHIFMIYMIWGMFGRYAEQRIRMEKFAAIGELASMMAHNMKTPLGTILNSATLVRNHWDDASIAGSAVDRIERSVRRMSHQIDGVMNYARDVPFVTSTASVREMLARSLESITVPENIGVRLPENDALIRCDPEKMELVFVNLLLNAIQAIGRNRGDIRVRIAEDAGGGNTAVLEFENSGPPIPKKDIGRIFDPMFTTKIQGTGLGLAICSNVVESQHGGGISVSNDPVRFRVLLPQGAAADRVRR